MIGAREGTLEPESIEAHSVLDFTARALSSISSNQAHTTM